ncbi:hypothetical protein JTE90_000913 [Oedothorax gibbosus]|uniref:Uncharacterized protein n=1 Tax=Oedothorax gibbosus TaxID=931172 RepID=A0AAV6VTJ2_9ARAC|nr:hypothetical protein JTE90_000913 [Oedothorax gibbosus]
MPRILSMKLHALRPHRSIRRSTGEKTTNFERSIPPVAGTATTRSRLLSREPDLQVSSESGGNEVEIPPPFIFSPPTSSTIPFPSVS